MTRFLAVSVLATLSVVWSGCKLFSSRSRTTEGQTFSLTFTTSFESNGGPTATMASSDTDFSVESFKVLNNFPGSAVLQQGSAFTLQLPSAAEWSFYLKIKLASGVTCDNGSGSAFAPGAQTIALNCTNAIGGGTQVAEENRRICNDLASRFAAIGQPKVTAGDLECVCGSGEALAYDRYASADEFKSVCGYNDLVRELDAANAPAIAEFDAICERYGNPLASKLCICSGNQVEYSTPDSVREIAEKCGGGIPTQTVPPDTGSGSGGSLDPEQQIRADFNAGCSSWPGIMAADGETCYCGSLMSVTRLDFSNSWEQRIDAFAQAGVCGGDNVPID